MIPVQPPTLEVPLLDVLMHDWDRLFSNTVDRATYRVAGMRVRIASTDAGLGRRIGRSLRHLRDSDEEHVSLEVIVCQGPALSRDVHRTFHATGPMPTGAVIVRGRGWQARWDPADGIVNVLDRRRRRALFWTADETRLPFWEEHAPLRHIFHWWLTREGFRIVHAAGVGTPSGGALVIGPAGSGKSSVAAACLGSGLRCSGDDYQLVQTAGDLRAFSLYSCLKLETDVVGWFPYLAGSAEMMGGKARFFLDELTPADLLRDFPIRAVLVPKVVGGASRIVPMSAGRALAALAPSSILQMHAVEGDPLGAMAGIVSRASTFRLELGKDLERIPSLLRASLG